MAAGDWRQRHESELPDHYEKRLQNLSKEEAAVLTRMRHRALFSRRGVQNLIVLSILGEVWQFASLCVTSVKSDARMEAPTLLRLPLHLRCSRGSRGWRRPHCFRCCCSWRWRWGASSSPWATSSPAATTSPGATATSSPFHRSATTGRRWFSGTGRATRQPSLPNGQASGSLHPLLSLLAIYGRYACFRKMEMQGKLYKQLPSYERSNKTSKLQKFLMQQANCQGTVTFSVCSDAPKVID